MAVEAEKKQKESREQLSSESVILGHAKERIAGAQEHKERVDVKDVIFHELMLSKLADNFIEALKDADYGYEDIQRIALAIDSYEDRNEIANMLAIPWDIMQRRIAYFKKNNLSAEDIVKELEEARKEEAEEGNKAFLAFNTEVLRLKPAKNDRTGELTWGVPPTEESNLANHKLAFASPNYHTLYREKPVKYIYAVRDWQQNKKIPNNPECSYAGAYAIVFEEKLSDVDQEVKHLTDKLSQEEEASAV